MDKANQANRAEGENDGEGTGASRRAGNSASASPVSPAAWAVVLAHVGFFTLIAQSILIREFFVLYLGGEVALGIFYAAWLGWIGVGAAAYLPFARGRSSAGVPLEIRGRTARAATIGCLALLPAALLLELDALRWGRWWTGVPASEIVPLGRLALATILATSLVGVPAGFAFSAACRVVGALAQEREGPGSSRRPGLRWVGFLFGFEAVGGFVGGCVYTFYLVDKLSADGAAWLLAGLVGLHLAAWGFARRERPGRGRGGWRPSYSLAALGVLFAVAAFAQIALPSGRQRLSESHARRFARFRPGFELAASLESRYERLELARRGGQYTLFANGKIAFSFPERLEARNRAALAMAQIPGGARRILLLGSAESGLLAELLSYPGVESIDVVAINPCVSDLVRPYLKDEALEALDDPRARRFHMDPRAFANRLAPKGAYDLVVVDAPDPTSASANRLYTIEFFERVRDSLRPGGVMVTGITSSANYLGRDVADYAGSAVATVGRAFDSVELAPGDYMGIFASSTPGVASLDASELAKRFAALPRPTRDPFPPEGFFTLLPPKDVEAVRARFASIQAPVNSDARPMTYYFGTIVWARFAGSSAVRDLLRGIEERRGAEVLLGFLALALVFRLVYRHADKWARAEERAARFDSVATAGILGCLGMSISILLLMEYQCSVGFLYERIGLLSALFMAGLAAGSILAGPAAADLLRPRPALLLTVAATGLLLLGVYPFFREGALASGVIMTALTLAGALVGGAFAASARVFAGLPARTGAWLDAADHAGGALGAVLTGTLAVPLLGFRATIVGECLVVLALFSIHFQALVLRKAGADRAGTRALGESSRDEFRPWAWALVLALTVCYLYGMWSNRPSVSPQARAGVSLASSQIEAWTGEKSWKRKESPILHWEAAESAAGPRTREAGKNGRRVLFATDQTAPEVRGYAGPITLAIDMDRSTVRGVYLIRHDETPAYVSGLAEWLRGFAGLPADRPARLGRDVDAISGATVTCRAAVETFNRSIYRAGRQLLGLRPDPEAFAQPSWRKGLLTRESIWVALCFLVFFPVYRWGGDRARIAFLILTVAVLGFGLNREFTLLEIGNLALGRLPSASNAAGAVMATGVVVVTFLFGNAFCGYICPFGAIQEIAARFARGGESRRFLVAGHLRALRGVRYVLAAAALSGFFLTWGAEQRYVAWSPLETFYSWDKPALLWASALAALALALALPRYWCLTLCPAGAVLSAFNRLSLLRRTRLFRKPDYSKCDLGASAARPRDCLRCNRCLTLRAEPRRPSRGRETAALVLFGLALGAMAVVYWTGTGEMADARAMRPRADAEERLGAPPSAGQEAAARGREMDVRALDEALSTGRMSEREAMHYRRLAPPTPAAPRESESPEK